MQTLRFTLLVALAAFTALSSPGQANPVWRMQESGTTAGLRGIFSVDGTVAWASGTGGTVLRTTDGGEHWAKCATPDGAPDGATDGATLDFRGVQAWDALTAIVMASGPGEKSRLYKTEDGCGTWKVVLRNPEKEGFWDAVYVDHNSCYLLGDPVEGMFWMLTSDDRCQHWIKLENDGLRVKPGTQAAFAASNSSVAVFLGRVIFGSGGSGGGAVYSGGATFICVDACTPENLDLHGRKWRWNRQPVPVGNSTDASGAFSIGARSDFEGASISAQHLIAVGGDYTKAKESAGTAAWSIDGGQHWISSTTPPHGFRSSVQWSESLKAWITVGTNGSDISRDDGKTWAALDDGNWNALSLPFAVGPSGRIARMSAAVPTGSGKIPAH